MSRVPASTEPSWTSQEIRRAVADVGHLLRFRAATLRGRSRRAAPVVVGVLLLITVLVSTVPAYMAELPLSRGDVLLLLPSAYVSVFVVSILSAAASGGGRELIARETAVAFPVSPTTDHLGALLMAPLNIAWLLQGWAVLGATAYAVGPEPALPLALFPVVLWLVTGTALAQALAWVVEWIRRGGRGVIIIRVVMLVLLVVAGFVVVGDRLTSMLDSSPTVAVAVAVVAATHHHWSAWGRLVGELLSLLVIALAIGGWVAQEVARRPSRDEARVETNAHPPRPHPRRDLAALMRVDRAGIWRSVPMRRGMIVLTVFPGIVAVSGSFRWDMLGVFPGLVASGGALLFGVNSWCLDGRGALWRDSLPVPPRLAFVSRALVLLEILFAATVVTILVASLRAGVPTVSQLVAVLCAAVVVTLQVVATALRWSVRRPFAVDLRSSRATPAPPLVMVGYSARLALATTTTGLLFNVLSRTPWQVPVVFAVPFLLWSGGKLALTARTWANPVNRASVVATVAS